MYSCWETLSGAGASFFLGVVGAKAGMVAEAGRAATAAVRESKRTQGHAVLGTERCHKSLLRVEFWDCKGKSTGRSACATTGPKTETPRLEPERSSQQGYCTTTVLRVKLKD